jgi:hypothetical protein
VERPTGRVVLLATALTIAIASLAPGTTPDSDRVAHMLRTDMTAPHEAIPHGVPPSYDWAARPRPRPVAPPADFRALTGWGQLYRCANAPFDPDDTIELRDLQTWLLVGDRWRQVQRSSALGGSAFAEDYARPPVPARVVARSARGTSVHMVDGYSFHFWPGKGRVAFDPGRVRDVAVIARARRISHGSGVGCFVLSIGADYWRSRTSPGGPGNVTDAGIGRFKLVGRRWRAFGMTTASAKTLAHDPLRVRIPSSEMR